MNEKSAPAATPAEQEQMIETARMVLAMLGERDIRLKQHSERVANLCANFCEKAGILSGDDLLHIYLAGLLHDTGCISIPREVLTKDQPLSDEEMLLIKKHPVVGVQILSHHRRLEALLPVVRHHHEAFDGSGYPDKKKGEEIPLGARLIQLFDRFDELASNCRNAQGMTAEEALAAIREKAGKEFDPGLIPKFIHFMESNAGKAEDYLLKKQAAFVKQSFSNILQKFSAGKIVPPVMPQVVFELRNVIKREEATVKDVSEILEKDPVLSLRLISVARSPIYKGYGDVKSVQAAIPRLGFKETLSIVVAISNKSLYEVKLPQFRVALDKMWGHSLACAYASKLISQSLFLDDPETVFLMGLTHDVGKVILLRAFAEIPQEKSLDFTTVMTAIQEAHQSIGSILLKRWGFGDEFSRVVCLHEGTNFSPQTVKEILVVHLANMLTRKMGLSSFEWDGKNPVEVASAQLLGLSSDTLGRVEEKVKEIIKDVAHLF
ncbi:MAG: HDOD domain-containing protein [Deltaproteobacteria bacterium]|nr:HDOD domain-containing protein [Deltaproteobacteria bacterium]